MNVSPALRAGKQAAIDAFDGVGAVADALGITSQAVSQWRYVPKDRALELAIKAKERGLALTLHDMRPDHWGPGATVPTLNAALDAA
ncbi:MAG TPA: Cro/CI family transcriptional regulator [Gammaproteobacteria bacterium]|nr:Cro/CI family transcriptional regulator [Gammaproteobacteria bacterium]